EDQGPCPALQQSALQRTLSLVIIQLPDDRGDELMAEIEVRWTSFQAQIGHILRTALRGVVVELDAVKRVAVGVKAVEHDTARHSQLCRRLQPIIGSRLIRLREQDSPERATRRCASRDAGIIDRAACNDVTCGAGGAGRSQSAGGGSIDVLGKRQIVAEVADVGRGDAEIRGDLPLDREIELVAIRPLEILRKPEEGASGGEELGRNERKWIGAADAAAAAVSCRTSHS